MQISQMNTAVQLQYNMQVTVSSTITDAVRVYQQAKMISKDFAETHFNDTSHLSDFMELI